MSENLNDISWERVVLETPFAGDIEANLTYARKCMADCLKRGEAPFASHLLYTQEGVLDDTIAEERERGIKAGFAWGEVASKVVVYTDRGVSVGMQLGIDKAQNSGLPVEYRSLAEDPAQGTESEKE